MYIKNFINGKIEIKSVRFVSNKSLVIECPLKEELDYHRKLRRYKFTYVYLTISGLTDLSLERKKCFL